MIAEPTSQLPSATNEERSAVRSGAWLESVQIRAALAHDAGRRVCAGQHGARSDSRETVCYIPQLVLSLFPGIGLLDRAFELAGFCVVRGPDLIWGGDVRTFHPPPKWWLMEEVPEAPIPRVRGKLTD